MNRKKIILVAMQLTLLVLVCSMFAWQTYQAKGLAPSYDARAGDIAGAVTSDLINITATSSYTASVASTAGKSVERLFIECDRFLIRAATSPEAAASLSELDYIYQGLLAEQGITEFSTRAYCYDNSKGVVTKQLLEERTEKVSVFSMSTKSYETDDTGNETCAEEAYDARLSYESFETYDYDSFDTNAILIDGSYADIQDELDDDEKENEYEETANQFIGAGFNDVEATMIEVMKAKIAKEYALPIGSITILNYTVNDCWGEVELDEKLCEAVRDAYDEAESAALIGSATFWTKFKEQSPLKLGRMQVGQKLTAWSQGAKNWFVKAKAKSCEKVRGMTKVFQKLALGDKLKKGWNKFTNSTKSLLSAVKTGTQKFVKKSFGFIGTMWKRTFRIALFVIGGVLIVLILLVVFNRGKFGANVMIPI